MNLTTPSPAPASRHFTTCQRPAWVTLRAAAGAAAWIIGTRREVETYKLTDAECLGEGKPLGATEPCIYLHSLVGAARWRLDAWDDGEGTFNLKAFGFVAEVHHKARGLPAIRRPALRKDPVNGSCIAPNRPL